MQSIYSVTMWQIVETSLNTVMKMFVEVWKFEK